MRNISIFGAVGIFALATCVSAVATPPDPSRIFAQIDECIDRQDFVQANSLLGELIDSLLAAGEPPIVGAADRRAMDAGRGNHDVTGLVRQARLTWVRAARNEQPWSQVMVDLSIAFSSASTLESGLPPALRYQQARARYEAAPSIIRLHQLTLRAFEAGEYAATSKYVAEERKQIPGAYGPEGSGLVLNRLETLAGILELKAGNVAGGVEALSRSAAALKQCPAHRLIHAPGMLLAQELLRAAQLKPVLAYLDICAQFEYSGGEEYTDIGKNPYAPAQLKAAILSGVEPQFSRGTLRVD